MKRIISMILIITVIVGMQVGCQKTPENPIIVQKGTVQSLEEIAETNDSQESQPIVNRLAIPDTMKETLSNKNGNLSVVIDARIVVPDGSDISMTRVGHKQFTEADAKLFAEILFKDAAPLDTSSRQVTKVTLQKSINDLLEMKQNGNLGKYSSIDEIDNAISELVEEAKTAPDQFVYADHNYQSGFPIMLRAAPNAVTISNLTIEPENIEYCKNMNRYAAMSMVIEGTPVSSAALSRRNDLSSETGYTPETAYDLAIDTMGQLELDSMVCSGRRAYSFLQEGFSTYEFMFTRELNGIEVTYTNDRGNEFETDSVSAPWSYEAVRIFIDETGVCYLVYSSPYETLETLSGNVKMLSFEEIRSIADLMLPVINDPYNQVQEIINVNEIKLGLMRIMEKDGRETGLIIPVWDFLGTSTREQSSGEDAVNDDPYTSYLTINAVDGSIIDRRYGY